VIEPLLSDEPRGVRRVDDRSVLNGIFWISRSGAPWRDLPERYGGRAAICSNRFVRWAQAGRGTGRWSPAPPRTTVNPADRQHLRSRPSVGRGGQKGADHCLARSRCRLTTRIHVSSTRRDSRSGPAWPPGKRMTARSQIRCSTTLARAPLRRPRRPTMPTAAPRTDPEPGPTSGPSATGAGSRTSAKGSTARNLIERFFSKLKRFRRVATRCEKSAANFLAMVQTASMRLWPCVYEPAEEVERAIDPLRWRQRRKLAVARFRALPVVSGSDSSAPGSSQGRFGRLVAQVKGSTA